MSAHTTSLVVFGCVFGGALLGVFFRSRLPHHHMSAESKDSISSAPLQAALAQLGQ